MVECEVITCYHVNLKPVDPDNDDTMKIIAGVGEIFIILVVGLLWYYKIKSCRARQNELFDQPPHLEEQSEYIYGLQITQFITMQKLVV